MLRLWGLASGRGKGQAIPMRSIETGSPSPRRPRRSLPFRVLRGGILAVLVLAGGLLGLSLLYRFVPPVSTLMLARWVTFQPVTREWKPLSAISPRLVRAVVLAEDARFCLHGGVDWEALRNVLEDADEDGPARGASTLTMQTVKNLFLWHGRSYVRKGFELPLAMWLGLVWPKDRVIEVYLNIAEWGDGIFGAEAAAQAAFGKPAANLSFREAALLARALPNPLQRSAGKPDRAQQARAASLMRRLTGETAELGCLGSD